MNLKKFGIGLIAQLIIKFGAAGLGFFSLRWLNTVMPPEDYATYNVILAYNAALLMALWLGIPQILQKYYTQHHQELDTPDGSAILKRVWTTFAVVRLASYALGILIICITYPLSQTSHLGLILGLFTAQFILIADFAYRSVCDSMGTAWKFSVTDFIGKLCLIIALYIGLYLEYPQTIGSLIYTMRTFVIEQLSLTSLVNPEPYRSDYLTYFITVSILAYLTGLIIDTLWQRRYTRFGAFDPQLVRINIKPIIYLSISYVAYSLYYTTIPLFLAHFGYGAEVISGYANAYKFFEIASIIPGLSMPTIASLVKKRIAAGQTLTPLYKFFPFVWIKSHLSTTSLIYTEWLCIALSIGIGTSIGLLLFGTFGLRLIDPTLQYPLAIPALRILAFASIPQTIMYFTSTLNILSDGEKYESTAAIILAITALLCYSILIPLFGIYGASWSVGIIFIIDFCLKFFFVRKTLLRPA